MPNFVEIGQIAAEIWRFFDFSKMAAVRHLGFVMCVWTTHEGHLVVFIIVQNLVGIDAVGLIICMFFDFSSLAGKRLFIGVFGGFDPRKWGSISAKGTSLGRKMSYDVQIVKIGPPVRPVRVTKRPKKKERQRQKPNSGKLGICRDHPRRPIEVKFILNGGWSSDGSSKI